MYGDGYPAVQRDMSVGLTRSSSVKAGASPLPSPLEESCVFPALGKKTHI